MQKLHSESRLKQRRTTSDPIQFIPRPRRQSSLKEFRNDMHHAATETYMITRLAITLLKLLGYVLLTVRTTRFYLRLLLFISFCRVFSKLLCWNLYGVWWCLFASRIKSLSQEEHVWSLPSLWYLEF